MQYPRRLGAILAALVLLGASSAVHAEPRAERATASASAKKKAAKKADAARTKKRRSAPSSIGAPNLGRLEGAARLRTSHGVVVRKGAAAWGLPDLVKLIQRATAQVARKHLSSSVLVGDLSARDGGPLSKHNSHQSGRDADIGFYATNSKGRPYPAKRFLAFDDEGRGRDAPWARFDEARNWTFVRALLEDEKVRVRYIFVTHALRAKLLAHGKLKGAPKDVLTRAALAMMSPSDADLHDDHFHIRIACPASMRGTCVEESSPRGKKGPVATDDAPPARDAKPPPEPKDDRSVP